MPTYEDIKKVLFNEITILVAVVGAVFWIINYINAPIGKIQLDIALIQRDVSQIKDNSTAAIEAIKIQDARITALETKQTTIYTTLQNAGIIK